MPRATGAPHRRQVPPDRTSGHRRDGARLPRPGPAAEARGGGQAHRRAPRPRAGIRPALPPGSIDVRAARVADVMGMPGYVAPEVLGGARPSPRSDLYSLGVVAQRFLAAPSWPDDGHD